MLGGYKVAEYLDVIDENGNLTGEVVDREVAHCEAIRHRASHLWLVRVKNGKIQVLLQKRSSNKEAFPNCYDISSAGHVPAGEDFEISAIRELKEELGISANKKDLIFCGDRNVIWDGEFNGKPFRDRQHSKVFMMWIDLDENEFIVDPKEVENVRWIDLEECIESVKKNLFQHYISMEELQIISKALKL
ncbi:TPA: NUDIX domain-containing protein [Clostridioides difficile]|nr:NUDIX domain-containing protein [Clostridioides difficile]